MNLKIRHIYFLFFIPTLFSTTLYAESARTNFSNYGEEKTKNEIEKTLSVLDPEGYTSEEETLGFDFLLSNKFFSPYTYNIYGGQISVKNPAYIVRVEGEEGDVHIIEQIFSTEKIIDPIVAPDEDPVAKIIKPKSYIISQTLNLAAPWLATIHASYGSPRLTKNQTWRRFFGYLFMDIFMSYAIGTNFFKETYQPAKHNDEIVAGLVAIRLWGMAKHFNLVRGHNRIAEMKYTFYFY